MQGKGCRTVRSVETAAACTHAARRHASRACMVHQEWLLAAAMSRPPARMAALTAVGFLAAALVGAFLRMTTWSQS